MLEKETFVLKLFDVWQELFRGIYMSKLVREHFQTIGKQDPKPTLNWKGYSYCPAFSVKVALEVAISGGAFAGQTTCTL
jgi:hypothetical protein